MRGGAAERAPKDVVYVRAVVAANRMISDGLDSATWCSADPVRAAGGEWPGGGEHDANDDDG